MRLFYIILSFVSTHPNTIPPSSEPSPSEEDTDYTATLAALKSLGYSTEHYTERHKKIEGYKKQLIEYAGENVNLEICANAIYGIKDAPLITDPTYIHPDKAVIGNYVSVDEVLEVYKTGKLKKVLCQMLG